MLTETISGKCPVCSYDKLRQRYGSSGYYMIDGCPSCGWGCGGDWGGEIGTEYWIDFSLIDLAYEYSAYIEKQLNADSKLVDDNCFDCIFAFVKKALEKLPQDDIRYLIYESHQSHKRSDDVEGTLWQISHELLVEYILDNNPIIFNSDEQQHSKDKNEIRKRTEGTKYALCELIRRTWDWEECPTGTGLRSAKNLGCGCHDVNGGSKEVCVQPF